MLHRHLPLRYLLMLLALLTAGCATLTPPEISLIGVQPIGSQGLEPRLRLEFRVLNPGRKPLTVQGVDLSLALNGVDIARGVSHRGFTVPAFGETVASLDVSASVLTLVRVLVDLPDAQTLRYALDGRLHLAGFPRSVPITRSGSIDASDLGRFSRRPRDGA